MNDSAAACVLIATADIPAGRLLQSSVRRLGCRVKMVSDASAVLAAMEEASPSVMILDRELRGGDGADVLRELSLRPPLAGAEVVFIADFAQFGGSPRDFSLASVCMSKPFDVLNATDVVQQLLGIAPGDERYPRITDFVSIAQLQPGDVALDLGCGRGYSTLFAAKQAGPDVTIIGLDWQPESLRAADHSAVAHGRDNVHLVAADIRALPLADEAVQAVISTNTLRYVGNKVEVLREIARVLARGGEMEVEEVLLSEDCSVEARELVRHPSTNLRGALPIEEYLAAVHEAGLRDVRLMNASERTLAHVTSRSRRVQRRLAALKHYDAGGQLLAARVHARKG